MALNARQFNKFYWISSVLVFAIVALRCCLVPFAHDEVATFNFYIQNGAFLPFLSHVDAMGHFLLSATSWLSFKLFGSSVLALRLPVLLTFVVLCAAVFKLNNLFSSTVPKIVLTFSFLFSYHFLAFYSLARGYGMSMAFLLFALYYFYCYIRHFSFRHYWKFLLFSQLALSANLTLVFVLLICSAIISLFQLKRKQFFTLKNILLHLLNLAIIGFWVKFGFYLQNHGALYYGGGSSYWSVTFKTLIEVIAFKSVIINAVVLLLFGLMAVYFCLQVYKQKLVYLSQSNFAISFAGLTLLIISFYLLKKLFQVNYPEDRTGLFFYVFYILSLSFMMNEFKRPYNYLILPVPAFFIIHLILNLNFRVHPWPIYETIPTNFYKLLVQEQAERKSPITIGGHRMREFIFGFLNYNGGGHLNYMTSPEALQLNCDYAIAYAADKPWYDNYYNEIATENDWGFRLIKRKKDLQREVLYSSNNIAAFRGNYEYYNAFEKLDTSFNAINPLMAEFEFDVTKAPVPFNAWLVVQIESETDQAENVFVRVPLNLLKYDWNGTSQYKTSVVTGNIPLKIKRLVCYLWNIDKQEVQIKVNTFRLLRINGDAVTEISKAKF